MDLLLDAVVIGVLLGCFYGAVSLGLSVSFGLLDVPHVAHPAFLVLASYAVFFLNEQYGIDPLLAGLLITPLFFVFGLAAYRLYYETFERRGSDAGVRGIAFFFGIAFIIEVLIILQFGVDQRSVTATYVGKAWRIGDMRIPFRLVVAFVVAAALTILLTLYLSRTFMGRAIRAVAQDQEALRLMGANPIRIKQWAFGIATAVLGIAGALLIIVAPVEPTLDRTYIGRTFCVVVMAGLGSMSGTLVAAIILGVAETIVLTLFGASWAPAISFAMLLGVLAAVLLMTQVVGNQYPFFAGYVILQFIVLAVAWSILGGYAGYVNFGTSAFFGMGVYTAVFLLKAFGAPLAVQIAAAAAVGALMGFALGLLTLRMQGIFFSIATIALTIIIETSITNWRYVGGAAGIQIQRPAVTEPFSNYVQMLFFVQAILVVLAVAISRYMQNSWIGRGLQALKDDELAAECTGVPTLRLKLLACVISGALMCAAGAPAAMYVQYADPASAFNLNYSVSALAMSLIGGTAHWAGPIIGAILLSTTQQLLTVTISSEVNVLLLGVMLVLFVVGAPEGIIGLIRRVRRNRNEGEG